MTWITPYQLRTQQEWSRLDAFAASFEHYIDPSYPHLVLRTPEDKWVGFAKMISVPPPGGPGAPVICTAWHPNATPREVFEGIKVLLNWALMAYGKAATVTTVDSPFSHLMEKMGFRDTGLKLFLTK